MARCKAAQERPFKELEVEVLREAIFEANLWIAVIDQALKDLLSQSQHEAAIRWLKSDRRDAGSSAGHAIILNLIFKRCLTP